MYNNVSGLRALWINNEKENSDKQYFFVLKLVILLDFLLFFPDTIVALFIGCERTVNKWWINCGKRIYAQ